MNFIAMNEQLGLLMALSATYRKTYKQNMYILISYIQVKSLVADTLYTIFVYCIFVYTGKKCVSYLTFYLYIRNKNKHILYIRFSVSN